MVRKSHRTRGIIDIVDEIKTRPFYLYPLIISHCVFTPPSSVTQQAVQLVLVPTPMYRKGKSVFPKYVVRYSFAVSTLPYSPFSYIHQIIII